MKNILHNIVLDIGIYTLCLQSVQASLLEISCLQDSHILTSADFKWPITSTKTNRLLVLDMGHPHVTYEICPSIPTWDMVCTRFSHVHLHQMTFDLHQKHWHHLLNLGRSLWGLKKHIKYEVSSPFPSSDMMFTGVFPHFNRWWPYLGNQYLYPLITTIIIIINTSQNTAAVQRQSTTL